MFMSGLLDIECVMLYTTERRCVVCQIWMIFTHSIVQIPVEVRLDRDVWAQVSFGF